MKNFIQLGNTVTVTLSGAVLSGDGLLVGNLFGVASNNGGDGDDIEMQVTGVFDLPKAAADAPAQFDAAYWDAAAKEVTTEDTDNVLIGVFMHPYGNGTTSAHVRLNGVAAFPTPEEGGPG